MSEFFDTMCAAVERPISNEDGEIGGFWRKLPPEFYDTGEQAIGGLFEHQLDWWNLPNFVRILVGGYGAGKTFVGSKRIISLALANAPCSVATVSPTFPVARQTVIATIAALLHGKESLFGQNFWWKYNASLHEFRIRFHGRHAHIICYSGDKPMSLRGPNLAAAYVDEPFIQDVEVFKQMIARVRHPAATHREICMTGTPEQLNWGYDLCVGDARDRHDVGYLQASTASNLALDDDYVPRLEGAFADKEAAAYIGGKFVHLGSGLVYYPFEKSEHVQDLEMPEGADLGVGMDFNVDPMAAAVFWRAGSHIHYIDEIELPNADTEYMCSILNEKYNVDRQQLFEVYPDATGSARKTAAPGGKSDFWYIRRSGLSICARHSNPKRRDRYNAVNGKLKPVQGKPSITISPKCRKLRAYLSTYAYNLMKKQVGMTHLLDAFSYPIAYLFPVDRDQVKQRKLIGV